MSAAPEQIAEAVRRLHGGEPVIVPTDTLYGLACDATDAPAVRRVFALKRRDSSQPLSVLVSSVEMARQAAAEWPEAAERLADAFWPGALTLVLPRAESLPPALTGGGPTIGVRMPAHPVTLALIEAFGRPIVGTSANRTGEDPPRTAGMARAAFDHGVFTLDGGQCTDGSPSAVVEVTRSGLILHRNGSMTPEAIRSKAREP